MLPSTPLPSSSSSSSSSFSLSLLLVILSLAVFASFPPSVSSVTLPVSRNVSKAVSVSGISSGAFMATQYEIAFSSSVVGAGIVAGGPYYCAEGLVSEALAVCLDESELIVIDQLIAAAYTYQAEGTIDSLRNLEEHNVYMYSSPVDTVVPHATGLKLMEMYKYFNVSKLNVDFDIMSGHGFPTLNYGVPCAEHAAPYLNKCNYDGAGAILNTIYPDLKPRQEGNYTAQIRSISQSKFTPLGVSPSTLSLAEKAYVFTPSSCTNGAAPFCRVHVVFHGCMQPVGVVGMDFVMNAGYLEWAETNSLIILFPQTEVSNIFPFNPKACWDWWGYTMDPLYATSLGPQLITVKNMVDAITN